MAGWLPIATPQISGVTTFATLKIGGGGFVRNINISPRDDTMVVRCDSPGGWKFDPAATNPGNAGGLGAWVLLPTASSLPDADIAADNFGVTEVAAYNSSVIYMNYHGFIFVTVDGGATFTRGTGFTQDNTGAFLTFSNHIAVDTCAGSTGDVVFAASSNVGMFKTANGKSGASATWSAITTGAGGIPAGSRMGVAFDPSSTITGGKTQGIYAWSEGNGVYRSTDGGSTWAVANATGQPTTFKGMRVDQLGNCWVYNDSSTLFKFNGTSWSSLSPGGSISALAFHPTLNAGKVVVYAMISGSANMDISLDTGATWVTTTGYTLVATDIPWLACSNIENSTSIGALAFDSTGVLWFAMGIGVYKTTPPTTATTVTWTSVTAPIEQLIGNMIVVPPNGRPNVFSWDREQFYQANFNTYPSAPAYHADSREIVFSGGGDWVVGTPTTMVMFAAGGGGFEVSGTSTDGGITWLPFGPQCTTNAKTISATGSQTITGVTAGLNLSNGDDVALFRTSNPNVYFRGSVTSYSGTTLVMNVTDFSGTISGFTDWIVHTFPTNINQGGSIAATSTTNFLIFASEGSVPWYTTDGGLHWNSLGSYFNSNFGIPTSGNTGWGSSHYDNSLLVAADRVTANMAYCYNCRAAGSGGGFYRTTDGGATWALRNAGGGAPSGASPADLAKLKAVPNLPGTGSSTTGHLFWINNNGSGLYFTKDGCTNWAQVPNTTGINFVNVNAFGFGAVFPGQSYPAIYVVGYKGSQTNANYGMWRCVDFNPTTATGTWTRLAQYPNNSHYYVKDVDGDKTTYGTVYAAQGIGYYYGHL